MNYTTYKNFTINYINASKWRIYSCEGHWIKDCPTMVECKNTIDKLNLLI